MGKELTWSYSVGGYFYRPPGAVHGGPMSGGDSDAVWVLRETEGGTNNTEPGCEPIS